MYSVYSEAHTTAGPQQHLVMQPYWHSAAVQPSCQPHCSRAAASSQISTLGQRPRLKCTRSEGHQWSGGSVQHAAVRKKQGQKPGPGHTAAGPGPPGAGTPLVPSWAITGVYYHL
jgi:hypothetical protein